MIKIIAAHKSLELPTQRLEVKIVIDVRRISYYSLLSFALRAFNVNDFLRWQEAAHGLQKH